MAAAWFFSIDWPEEGPPTVIWTYYPERGGSGGGGGGDYSPYDPRVDFLNYAKMMIQDKDLTDCEKLVRMVAKAGEIWPDKGDMVRGLLAGLTDLANITWYGGITHSDPNYRVGVFSEDVNYLGGFSDTGFKSTYVDPDRDSANQVRHFVGWFAAGYLGPDFFARRELRNQESTGDLADIALGDAAIGLGDAFRSSVFARPTLSPNSQAQALAQRIWHDICGGTRDVKFP
jgi:hypothetical protein